MAYTVYPDLVPGAWSEGSESLDILLGGINPPVLIGSSLTLAARPWRSAQTGANEALTVTFLLLDDGPRPDVPRHQISSTSTQYDSAHPRSQLLTTKGPTPIQVEMFISLYFALTGLHALHMVIGFGIMSVMT
jgi:cytochrome c oxidase subunit 3